MDNDDGIRLRDEYLQTVINTAVNQTIVATVESIQTVISTYINNIEDQWQVCSDDDKKVSKQAVNFSVNILTKLNSAIDQLKTEKI